MEGLTAIFTGVLWIIQSLVAPETYTPVLLRRRAEELSKRTGKVYRSKVDAAMPRKTLSGQIKTNLSRPWVLLFKEPIVFLTSIYMAIVYGTLYLCFAAFPIVFQSPYPEGWGWKPGVGGLSFVGIAVGMVASTAGTILDNARYGRIAAKHGGMAPPEARLPPALVGGVMLPVGLFWFAWTNGTNVHWVVPIIGSSVFASGLVLVFLSLMNYLIDSCKSCGSDPKIWEISGTRINRSNQTSFMPHLYWLPVLCFGHYSVLFSLCSPRTCMKIWVYIGPVRSRRS